MWCRPPRQRVLIADSLPSPSTDADDNCVDDVCLPPITTDIDLSDHPLGWYYTMVVHHCLSFWATVCATIRPMLSDHCLSCLSVCYVGVLWPNGWIEQAAIWYRDRPWPRPHYVRWEPSSHQKRGIAAPPLFGPCVLWPTVAHLSNC